MVSFEEIQTAYYMVAATGVLVAVIYYIINLRYNMKEKEMEISRIFTSDYTSDQGGYLKPEIFGKWDSMFFIYET